MNQVERMDVTFSLVDAKPHTFVKVKDENGANVVLDPMEIYILIHKWNHAPYTTVWGTSFKKVTALELVNSNKKLKKKLKKKGSNFFLIHQRSVHSHQSNQTVILNHGAVMELQTWINTVKHTNDYVNKSYSL